MSGRGWLHRDRARSALRAREDTSSYPDRDAAVKPSRRFRRRSFHADLDAAAIRPVPAGNGSLAVTALLGRREGLWLRDHNRKLKAAYVFYGTGPENAADAQGRLPSLWVLQRR